LDIYVFPKPVFPVNKRFFEFGLSKSFTNSIHFCLIFNIFCFGDILKLLEISFENIFGLKFSKFSLLKFVILDLLYEMFSNFCFKHEHITVADVPDFIYPVSLHRQHSYLGCKSFAERLFSDRIFFLSSLRLSIF